MRECLLQHGRRDRRGAVGDRAERGVIAVGRARDGAHHLDHRRHEDGVRDGLLLERVEHAGCVELTDEDRRRAVPEPQEGPADPADVECRQRRQADRVGIELPVRRGLGSRREVAVGREDALRDAGRPGRVHLHDRVADSPRPPGSTASNAASQGS